MAAAKQAVAQQLWTGSDASCRALILEHLGWILEGGECEHVSLAEGIVVTSVYIIDVKC